MTTLMQSEYAQRRKQFLNKLGSDSIAIIYTNPEYPKQQDSYYFRPNPNFYYLTGFSEPEAVAVFIPGREEGEYILFNRTRDAEKEMWDGYRAGQEGAVKEFGADQAFAYEELHTRMPALLKGKKTLFYQFDNDIQDIKTWREELRTQLRSGVAIPEHMQNVSHLVQEMRLIKTPGEIEVMRKAGAINVAAQERAMRYCTPGMTEAQLCSELQYVYGQHNALQMAYDPIVAGGDNACILHYRAGNKILRDGELVLIDMGEEHEWYASDVTRTFPVNGTFSAEQKTIYELVLHTQLSLLTIIKAGLAFNKMQDTAVRLITEGLVDIGLLKGNIDSLIEQRAYADFYPHRSGHWLGLEVHDPSNYKINGDWRALETGMVLTVEPGIYIQKNNMNVAEKWRGIGVRIEDDVVITATGCDNLTENAPKKVVDIEAIMRE